MMEVPVPKLSVVQEGKTPLCPKCGSAMVKTTTFKAMKKGVETEFQVFACFSHRQFTSIKNEEKEEKTE
jgi:hypothetical protein